jgi:phosphotransferase system  glucose/maltose/N-acetylglucosamine-specific IIC component
MQRQIPNFVIDTAALLVMLAMLATGFLLKWVLPPGSRGGQGLQLWGMTRHDWGDVHFWLAVALLVLALVHVALHWAWVCALVARWLGGASSGGSAVSHSRQWLYGVGFLIACCLLVTGFLWMARAQTERGGGDEGRGRGGFRGGRGAAAIVAPLPMSPA